MTSAESTVTDDDDFTSIPILNYALLSSPDTRPVFIRQLQHALINVGFLYLENTPDPDDALFNEVIAYLPRIFALPQERKEALRMVNSPHFLGYSRLGVERTRGAADQREQFDFATPFENGEWAPGFGQPEHVRLWGPSQVGVAVVVVVDFLGYLACGFCFASLHLEMKWSSASDTCPAPSVHVDVDVGTVCDPSAIFFFTSIMDDRDQLLVIIIIRGGRERGVFLIAMVSR